MKFTYNFETDVKNMAMEKIAMDLQTARVLLGGVGGALAGGLSGAATHYLNGELNAATMAGLDPIAAEEQRANKGSLINAALSGALLGGFSGLAGSSMHGREYSNLVGTGIGGLGGILAGLAQSSPGDMVRNYNAERVQHLGIPSSDVNVYNID